jgi:CRP/FNR family transcriptional regulator, cyclic AMP receptor protein
VSTLLEESVAQHPFARGLADEQIRRLAGCARMVRFPAGGFIFRESAEADTLYLLQRGRVALEQHVPGRGALQLENLQAGDLLGLSWILPAGRWTLDARVVEPVEALALGAECVRDLMRSDPEQGVVLATHLIDQLYHRLMRVRLQRLDVYGPGGAG